MIKSMTGYGRAQGLSSGYDLTVELKAVNHRYFEFSARVPRAYGYLEEKLKNLIHQQVSRGKVDGFVGITPLNTTDTQVQINQALARSYLTQLRALGEDLSIPDDLTLSKIASFGDIFVLRRSSEEQDAIWALVEPLAIQALAQFQSMRHTEGQQLSQDILGRLDLLDSYNQQIQLRLPEITAAWRSRLLDKLTELLESHQIEQSRLLTESALFAEKTAVDEETVRLTSHITQFRQFLTQPEAIGRKLDFLVQEINREINTIGSKCQDLATSQLVVEMKSETEKIREQIQNIE